MTRRQQLALALLALAQFLVVLDLTIVNVALPTIEHELDFSADGLQWVVNAYILAFGGFLLLGGRLADIYGARRVLTIGLLLFGLGSFAAGLADAPAQLIGARALQGLGAALLTPAALAMIAVEFSGARLNRAMGVWGAVAAVGGVTGVLLGGVLTATVGWRAVFWVNVPIVALAVAAVPVLLHPGVRAPKLPLDLAGAVTGTAGVSALVYAIAEAQLGGWLSQRTLLLFALAAAILGVFLVVERRARAPVLRLGMFRTRMFGAANVVMLIFTPGMFPQMYVASIYLQQVWGFNALHTGLAFIPQCLANLLSARTAGFVSVRIGIKPTLIIGLVVTGLGLALMSLVPLGGSYVGNLLVPFVVFALGTGFAIVTVTLASIVDVPAGEVGVAAGMISVSRQVGSALGIAVLGSIIAAHSGGGHAELATGVKIAFVVSAGLVFAATVAALLLMPRHRPCAVPEPVPVLDG